MASKETFNICLEHRGVRKWLVVYSNIPRNELYDVVCSAFNLENLDISGIRSESGVSFPLSLVAKAPSYFEQGVFQVVGKTMPAEETREPVVLSETVPVAEVQDVAPEYFDKSPQYTADGKFSLSNLTVEDIITAFQRHVSMDVIDRRAFTEIFEDLVANQPASLQTSAAEVLGGLFDEFDLDNSGSVDMGNSSVVY